MTINRNARKWELSVDVIPIIRGVIQMHVTTVVQVWQHESADSLLKRFESQMVDQFGRSHRIANVMARQLPK